LFGAIIDSTEDASILEMKSVVAQSCGILFVSLDKDNLTHLSRLLKMTMDEAGDNQALFASPM
jgi:hypothetical protein